MSGMSSRLCIEIAVSLLCSGFALLTLAWPDWLEFVLDVDPDGGNGAVEWAIVGVFALVALVGLVLARAEWQRLHSVEVARTQ